MEGGDVVLGGAVGHLGHVMVEGLEALEGELGRERIEARVQRRLEFGLIEREFPRGPLPRPVEDKVDVEVGSPALLRRLCRAATAGGDKRRKSPFCRPRSRSVVRRRGARWNHRKSRRSARGQAFSPRHSPHHIQPPCPCRCRGVKAQATVGLGATGHMRHSQR